ncbi:MAG TPA: hypothetical protein VGN34_26835 [Ktedonobacteraceae bacterium]
MARRDSEMARRHSENEDLYDGLINDPENNPYQHTSTRPFCPNMDCPCHENEENIQTLNGHVQNGIASTGDAYRIYRGQTV